MFLEKESAHAKSHRISLSTVASINDGADQFSVSLKLSPNNHISEFLYSVLAVQCSAGWRGRGARILNHVPSLSNVHTDQTVAMLASDWL